MTTAPYRSRPRERGDAHSAADASLSDLISPERLSVRVHGRQDAPGLWVPAFAGTTTGATAASRSSLLHRTHALAWRIGRPAGRLGGVHHVAQLLSLGVERGADRLTAQHNALEGVEIDLVELAALVAEPDREQRHQRVLGGLGLG